MRLTPRDGGRQRVGVGRIGGEGVALGIEALQRLDLVDTPGDDVAAHQPARALGVEADDLVAPALPVLEHRGDDAALELLRLDRLEILVGGQVHQHALAAGVLLAREQAVEFVGDALAPELVEVLATRVGKPGAHLEAVGLHQVERAQHAVKAGQDAQVVLRPGQVVAARLFASRPSYTSPSKASSACLALSGAKGRDQLA
jgi:hypothetical protein